MGRWVWHSSLGRGSEMRKHRFGEQGASGHGWNLGYVAEIRSMSLGGQQYLDHERPH